MPSRRRTADTRDTMTLPAGAPPTVAEVVAMLARIEAATARVEGKLDTVLAELASLPRPGGNPVPRPPVARHALRDRLPCRGHRPRLHGRQHGHDRRGH